MPAKNSDVFLKAEDEAEHAAWIECLLFTIEAFKKKHQAAVDKSEDDDTNEMISSTPTLPGSSDTAMRPSLEADVNSLEKVEDFEAFRSKYLLMKEIGEGSFSIVHRAVNRLTGRLCAVKCCKMSAALEEEERLLRTLSHPNVVGLEGVYARDNNLHYVVMDYLKNGDLCDLLIERQRLSEAETRRIIHQVVEGLAYLHRHCVLHRDIKPENILIHGNIVKIADFGLAKELAHPSTMLKRSCGTLEYAAPELLCGRPYGLKSDIFSLGVVMYVLLFGAFPFSVQSAAALQSMEHFPTGVDVVKYGYKEFTKPHSTTLTLNFMEESIAWTGRKIPMLPRMTSRGSENGAGDSIKRGRAILLREIQEIREGHTTDAFLLPARKGTTYLPPPEHCLSIICSWRTLDIVLEAPSQRDFMARGLRRLLPSPFSQ
ncbi:hypothetical protein JM18_006324 [Phytophthora kernoviae]|uniref:Protein kinase domain-containing protein n=3 Tax=Phytophthora kernoviae TaxID=325452 RepID=A0A8T0LT05_9STRA|nr:hypothetical protein G195_007903 [Phytophthora kernoviae 00238/432]KAG2520934.1 hypothetical protein JM16_006489 [Phytophthora kernoviae]KAG2521957.1 hypothetical protein JM18_006324 [Phytophthora kernoviae]